MERGIAVTIQDGKQINFKLFNDGLYYFDAKNNKLEDAPAVITIKSLVRAAEDTILKDNANSPVPDYYVDCSLLHTLNDNKQSFSSKQVEEANHARKWKHFF